MFKSKLTQTAKDFIKFNSSNFYIHELASMFECDKRIISNFCHYNCLRYKSKKITKDDIDYIINNHRKLTIDELASELEIKKASIKKIYKKMGLVIKEKETQKRPFNLSGRELDVINLISKGFSNKEICEKLFISLTTLKTHINNIYAKLGINRITTETSTLRVRATLIYLNLNEVANE